MILANKLKLAREHLHKSQKEMAAAVGSALRSWQGYEQGTNIPGGNIFESLAKLGFNIHWFFSEDPDVPMMIEERFKNVLLDFSYNSQTEEGKSKPIHFQNEDIKPVISIPPRENRDSGDVHYVPLIESLLSSDGCEFVLNKQQGEIGSFRKNWLEKVTNNPNNVVLMHVIGNSMFPTINNGDIVMIDTERRYIYDGNIYALRLEKTIVIKRLSLLPGNIIMILSDNKAESPPFKANSKEICVVGQVIWFGRSLVVS